MLDKNILESLYGESEESFKRYNDLKEKFKTLYYHEDGEFFSSPGRTEIIGNHVDHNGGKVIGSSISMDTIAIAWPNNTDVIRIQSDGYREVVIDLKDLKQYKTGRGTTALTAGMCEATKVNHFVVRGFDACLTSNVISSAGVSSSASYAMIIMSIINYFFNGEKMTVSDYAKIGQYAENKYWFKASGMLDQMACAIGGPVLLDFKDPNDPKYEKLDFSFEEMGYQLFIINTGESHADLNAEYSSIPNEMKEAAKVLGVERLCDTDLDALLEHLNEIENDRAKLRAIHFYKEVERVEAVERANLEKDYAKIIELIDESGRSSFEQLENCYCNTSPTEQKLALALALARNFIDKVHKGTCRVHGGGFKGTITCLIGLEHKDDFIAYMSKYFDPSYIYPMSIRRIGAIHI